MDDEKIYNAILDELRENGPRQGLWAKCFAEANGNENAAKALYFKYRAQQLINESATVKPKPVSTELNSTFIPAGNSTTHGTSNVTIGFIFLIFALIIFSIVHLSNEKNRVLEENKRTEYATQIVKHTQEKELRELVAKTEFKNLLNSLPNFNFQKENSNCQQVWLASDNIQYNICISNISKLSKTKINNLKNYYNLFITDENFTQTVNQVFVLHEKILNSWCQTFIDATWGQGTGTEAGVAGCEISVDQLIGKTLSTVASNFANSRSTQTSFAIAHGSNYLNNICNDAICLKKIIADTLQYENKIKTYLLSVESRKKYEESLPPGRFLWIQSLEKTNDYSRELTDLICDKLLATHEIKLTSQKIIDCKISLSLFWLENFSGNYENFKSK